MSQPAACGPTDKHPSARQSGFGGKLHRWQIQLSSACGGDFNVGTMVEEAEAGHADLVQLAANAVGRGQSSPARREEQRAPVQRLLDWWCEERAPMARSASCRSFFKGCPR